MLEQTTRIWSENLARAVNRRSFIKKAGETVFAGVAALAAGHSLSPLASAQGPGRGPLPKSPRVPSVPQCAPPGPYCNLTGISEPNGCHGSSCFQHLNSGTVYPCRVYYQFYQAGCWTTSASGGYWTCCDCECLNSSGTRVATCGCAQFNTSPVPRPDSPVGA